MYFGTLTISVFVPKGLLTSELSAAKKSNSRRETERVAEGVILFDILILVDKSIAMSTPREIQKLHSLFLSPDPNNWRLAAILCSESDFEQVIEVEVKRLCEGKDFEFHQLGSILIESVRWDYKLILGGRLSFRIEHFGLIEITRFWNLQNAGLYSTFSYDSSNDSFEYRSMLGEVRSGQRDQYLTDDLMKELDETKRAWWRNFSQLKHPSNPV